MYEIFGFEMAMYGMGNIAVIAAFGNTCDDGLIRIWEKHSEILGEASSADRPGN